ncbi:MAG TPA: bifunctional DNA-formamidopyrimidine glycosylase/DNA-(apurinic or apyrimidinic site) lyase [Steroidobacteraceae bacterium]|nr:bifunctional DNA-formamidopyrimidine glycosylase/DNA-(apurinic or apyrimidinic site) lyase [Steroidobacteraceae bacterium]
MPELPEVETTRRGIAPALLDRRVVSAIVRERRLRWPIASSFEARVRDQTVRKVERRAKYILIGFDRGTLILHLGMSGSLALLAASAPPKLHDHWDLVLDSGRLLRFHDPRRFGSLHWTEDDPALHQLLKRLAPEPLSLKFDAAYLYKVSRKRKVAIKQFIMNSRVVVGVGNIYASEALFRARIAPRRAAGRISRAQAAKLARAIKAVLSAAIKIGGTTLRDYRNVDGAPGYFRQKLFVYERAGARCRVCKSPIKQFTQGQRSTYWCATCQR